MAIPEVGLYIHIPFCRAKCHYCDFNSFPGMDDYIQIYFEALKKEMAFYREKLENYSVKTVFIGGGTPSSVDARYLYDIMDLCSRRFNIKTDAEVSMEANPGTLSREKLVSYRAMGINRLSIGLQSWQNHLLKKLGRIHDVEAFIRNFKQAEKAGFKNINIDLIFGIPGQTLNDWEETLSNIVEYEPAHVSCYSLKIEEETVFGKMLDTGELIMPDDELDREMYHLAIQKLRGMDYRHYEISNFAKPGCECRHNLIYWNAGQYIGFGAGAHSFFEGKRFNNIYNIESYIRIVLEQEIPSEKFEMIDKSGEISEFIILGLRLIEGISINEFKSRFRDDIYSIYGKQLNKLLKNGLLTADGDRIKLSSQGLDLANQVFVEFV